VYIIWNSDTVWWNFVFHFVIIILYIYIYIYVCMYIYILRTEKISCYMSHSAPFLLSPYTCMGLCVCVCVCVCNFPPLHPIVQDLTHAKQALYHWTISPAPFITFYFETGSHYIFELGFELLILLPHPPE
jgi:hypothetical protein